MKEFDQLMTLADRLMGPDGCPWDREQTWQSLKKYTLEEVYELLDAIDIGDIGHIQEELGDVLYNVIFYCKIAEAEGSFTTAEVVQRLHDKLYYRHPHVFGEDKAASAEDALASWESMKHQERGKQERKNIFDGLPKELPSLLYAQKILKTLASI